MYGVRLGSGVQLGLGLELGRDDAGKGFRLGHEFL